MTDVYLGREDRPPGLEQIASGKVRDIYALDEDHLLFVTTDRVSAFDVVMNEGVPMKGRVLTAIAAHWFERTRDIISNHLVSTSVDDAAGLDDGWRERLRGRVMVVRRATPDPIEWVVRGHIAGSGWKEYQEQQTICSIALPPGLSLAEALPEPLVTPTTKHEAHDRPLSPEEARDLVGPERWEHGKEICLALFERGRAELEPLGLRLADTKFELGVRDGEVLLIDEALTPDSSRMWDEGDYRVGISPPSFDKQILRDWLETLDWNKEYPAPDLDPAVVERVTARYLEVCERITGSRPEA
ncbi:MAG: phosphoribosylaminoimidazolesuccinocarboxamide synthase [Planctomycetota bacterium]|jgi:phosphoribosylaminoimidazole-succinocarboxamide synthase